MSWIDIHVQPGMTVVDIGANRGSITNQLLQRVGPIGAVYAIEPQPELAAGLRACTPHVITVAVGDHDDAVQLHYSQQPEHASLYKLNLLEDIDQRRTVLLRTLDSLQATGELPPTIDAIKVDAQGAEAAILRGATALLRTQRPMWYVELWALGLTQAGESVEGVAETFRAHGYEPVEQTWEQVCIACRANVGHGSIDVLVQKKD